MSAPVRRTPGAVRFLRLLLMWVAGNWIVVGAAVAPVVPGGWVTMVAIAVLATLPIVALLGARASGRYPGAATRLFVLRPFVYAQMLLPLAAGCALIGGVIGGVAGLASGASLGMVGGTARAGIVVACAVGVLGALLGLIGSRRLVLQPVDVSHPDLPAEFDGLRIVQLSDLHIGPQTSRAYLARVKRMVDQAAADIIVVTGDLIDDHAADVDAYARALGTLAAPMGVFVCAGNHDVYSDWPEVARRLSALPVTVLVNDARVLERGRASLAIAGTGDPAGRGTTVGPDIPRTLSAIPAGVFTVVLAHNPALWPALAERGVPLTLSGHTHWGQLALPSLGWSLATPFNAHAMGVHRNGNALLSVHPGTGFWGIPFRLGTPPEVAVVTLRRGMEAAVVRGRRLT